VRADSAVLQPNCVQQPHWPTVRPAPWCEYSSIARPSQCESAAARAGSPPALYEPAFAGALRAIVSAHGCVGCNTFRCPRVRVHAFAHLCARARARACVYVCECVLACAHVCVRAHTCACVLCGCVTVHVHTCLHLCDSALCVAFALSVHGVRRMVFAAYS
jgi:hypothetical protein